MAVASTPPGPRIVAPHACAGQDSTAIRQCAIDPAGRRALTAGRDLRQFDLHTGASVVLGTAPLTAPATGCSRRVRDGRTLFWSDRELLIHSNGDDSVHDPFQLQGLLQGHLDAALILGRLRLAVASRDGRGQPWLNVFDSLSPTASTLWSEQRQERTLWMDGFGTDGMAHGRQDGVVELGLIPESGLPHFIDLHGHAGPVLHGAVAPDDRHLVTAGADLTVRLWSIASDPILQGSLSAVCQGHTDQITGIAIAPDGESVATSSRDRTIRLWSIPEGRSIGVFTEHRDWITHVAVNPAGTHLASLSEDRTVKVWDLASHECVGTAYGVSRWLCLAMSADTVCAGDAAGNLWMLQYRDGEPEVGASPALP